MQVPVMPCLDEWRVFRLLMRAREAQKKEAEREGDCLEARGVYIYIQTVNYAPTNGHSIPILTRAEQSYFWKW